MKLSSLITFITTILAFASISLAQTKDQTFTDWTVYTTMLDGKKTCYMASFPKNKSGNYTRRDEPYFLVTRIDNSTYEVSVTSGYPYKKSVDVKADIEGQTFYMITDKEHAWAPDRKQDEAMVSAMKKKNKMVIKGTSTKGTYSNDSYSLSGFTAAYEHLGKLCAE